MKIIFMFSIHSYQTIIKESLQFEFQCTTLHAHKRRIIIARQVSRQHLTIESMFTLRF